SASIRLDRVDTATLRFLAAPLSEPARASATRSSRSRGSSMLRFANIETSLAFSLISPSRARRHVLRIHQENTAMSRIYPFAALALLLFAGGTDEASAADEHVTTIVVIKTPSGLTREKVEAGIHASVPTYQKILGLIRKWYTVNGESFGGMYL